MIFLRHATASQEVPLGYFLDSTDGDTAETGLTIANTDIKLHKAGATSLANKNSGGATHMSGGVFYAVLDATDTDTVGNLVAFVHVAGALAVKQEFVVLPAAIYDWLIAGSVATLPANVTQFGGTNLTATGGRPEVNTTHAAGTAWNSGAIGASTLASDTITAAKVAADVTTELQSGLATASALSTLAGYVDTEVASIKTVTDKLDDTLEDDGGTYRFTVNALEQAPSGTGASAATIAAAVWDEALAGHVDAGSAGAALGDVPTAIENADALLNRDMSTGTDGGSPTVRTVRQALRFLRNKWTIVGTTLSVKKEDDATESWSATVSTTPGADPVTGNDPA